jgi:hypothetical protein
MSCGNKEQVVRRFPCKHDLSVVRGSRMTGRPRVWFQSPQYKGAREFKKTVGLCGFD